MIFFKSNTLTVSGIGFPFHNPDTKENVLSKKNKNKKRLGKKITILTENHKFQEFLDFKDTAYRL